MTPLASATTTDPDTSDVTWAVLALAIFLVGAGRLALFFGISLLGLLIVPLWSLLTLTWIVGQTHDRFYRLTLWGILLFQLELAFKFATAKSAIAANDTARYIAEAHYIINHGGVWAAVGDLFTGRYPFFNRNPLISFLLSLLYRPEFELLIVGKMLSIAFFVLFLIALHWFTRRWLNRTSGLLLMAILIPAYPVFRAQAWLIASDLAVTAFGLLTLGCVSPDHKNESSWSYLLAGIWLGCAYWAKANALLYIPPVLLVIAWREWSLLKVSKAIGLFTIPFVTTASPILINNYLTHGDPLYNTNKQFLLAVRDTYGNLAYWIDPLPYVETIHQFIPYFWKGVKYGLVGPWYLSNLPGVLTILLFIAFFVGCFRKVQENWGHLGPLILIGLNLTAHGFSYALHPRYVFFAWVIYLAYASEGLRLLAIDVANWLAPYWPSSPPFSPGSWSDWGRLSRLSFGVLVVFTLLGFYPRTGAYADFLRAYEVPSGWNQLITAMKKQNIEESEPIVNGPSHSYAIAYAGYEDYVFMPYSRDRRRVLDWLKQKNIRWLVIDWEQVGRRERFWEPWLSMSDQTITVKSQFDQSPFIIHYRHPRVLLLEYAPDQPSA